MKKFILLILFVFPNNIFAEDLEKGKAIFAQKCSSCHGIEGKGDGAVAKALPPGTVTNLEKGPFKFATDIAKTKEIVAKGGATLKLNALMPPTSGLTEEELSDLAAFVISLRK